MHSSNCQNVLERSSVVKIHVFQRGRVFQQGYIFFTLGRLFHQIWRTLSKGENVFKRLQVFDPSY
jgi:hypothetical protein